MEFTVSMEKLNKIFVLPKEIVDDHLLFASAEQLRAILWIYRNNAKDMCIEELAKFLSKTLDETKDLLEYWIEADFLCVENRKSSKKTETSAETVLPRLPDFQPTYDQVVARLSEDKNLKYMCNEAQLILKKTLGYDSQAKFIMMHDTYGLPVEVILTIIQFADSIGKGSANYIAKVGKNWGEAGINTLEKAGEKLNSFKEYEQFWKKFASLFKVNPPEYTESRISLLLKWKNEYEFSDEMILLAYEKTVEQKNKVNFKYTDGILKAWHKQSLKSPDDVEKSNRAYKENTKNPNKNPSYDIELFKERSKRKIEYKRRG